MAHVYMLRCADGSYYVGSTRSLAKRLWEHQTGLGAAYTRERLPVELVWQAEYVNVAEAFEWEKRIQNWSRAKREALIRGDYEALPTLSRKAFDPAPRNEVLRSGPRLMPRLASVVMPAEVATITNTFVRQLRAAKPGLLHGLYLHGSLCWGEFFASSDIDFVAVLAHPPTPADLAALSATHAHLRESFPERRFEGFHCQPGDLARSPAATGPVPVHAEGRFDAAGRAGVNLVTWHELAERGLNRFGGQPTVHTDLGALLDYTHDNLTSYWQPTLARAADAGPEVVGASDDAVVWVTLGVGRLHHLLATRELTSKSGAGRYVAAKLDSRWHRLAEEALRLREQPEMRSAYDDPGERGRDVLDFLAWAIEDGQRLR